MAKMSRHGLADLLVSALQKNEDMRPLTEEEFEAEVQEKCVELWKEDQRKEMTKMPSLKTIPRLFTKRDFAPNSIAEHTRREARIRMLKKQESLLLEQEHLELAQQHLLQHALPAATSPANSPGLPSPAGGSRGKDQEGAAEARNWAGGARINYDGFCQVCVCVGGWVGGLECSHVLAASVAAIQIGWFWNYKIMQLNRNERAREINNRCGISCLKKCPTTCSPLYFYTFRAMRKALFQSSQFTNIWSSLNPPPPLDPTHPLLFLPRARESCASARARL